MSFMQTLLGGSTSKSGNKAYEDISSAYKPLLDYSGQGLSQMQNFLSGDASGFNRFKDATGFDWLVNQGSRGITGNAAARGLLRSGATAKALVDYGNNMQNQFANSYLDRLMGLSEGGFKAGSLLSDAGGFEKKKESQGAAGLIGGAMAMFSDRRLKKNIRKLGKQVMGLNLYSFKYKDGSGPFIGVMADEVEKIIPEALGPKIMGYQTVNYGLINKRLASDGI